MSQASKNFLARAEAFSERLRLRAPVLLGPMSGSCTPPLSIAVANAGGMGAAGVLQFSAQEIRDWVSEFRSKSSGSFQLNTWIPGPAPARSAEHERCIREFLATWGPEVPASAGDQVPPDFSAQCEAMLEVQPPVISSVMGLYSPEYVKRIKDRGIFWFAVVTTVAEALAAEKAGADAVVAQGTEAGGHRGSFRSEDGESHAIGLFSLLPSIAARVKIPVIAAGGITDGKSAAAAFILGASAVQVGTAFLRCPESGISRSWSDALGQTLPEGTCLTRVFSGRAGRSISTRYVVAAMAETAPKPAPYPVQRGLTASMRAMANKTGDVQRMQAWAGQSASLSPSVPAERLLNDIWSGARELLS